MSPEPPAYAETLSSELAPLNIRVLIVVPGSFRTPNLYPDTVGGTPIPSYVSPREALETVVRKAKNVGVGKGDPVRGMSVLVDVVRGEGRAKEVLERHGWPLWLFLGEDAVRDVRARVTRVTHTLDQWEDIANEVSFLDDETVAQPNCAEIPVADAS